MHKSGGPVFGIILIGIGILFLLDTLDIFSNDIIGTWWPAAFVVMGAWDPVIKRRRPHFGNLFMIVLGGLLLADRIYDDISIGELWPVWLIVVGASIVFGQFRGRRRRRRLP